jgi:hypothetical protein
METSKKLCTPASIPLTNHNTVEVYSSSRTLVWHSAKAAQLESFVDRCGKMKKHLSIVLDEQDTEV